MPEKMVENICPVLGVSDLQTSIQFYTNILGFALAWGGESGSAVCSVARDGWSIMLVLDTENRNSCVWIGLEDDRLFATASQRGARVVQEPTNRPWAYEMKIIDPDNNVLWLGTGPREDIPIAE